MAKGYKLYEEGKQYLMPLSITDWVPENSLARFISELLNQFSKEGRLKPFFKGTLSNRAGNSPYHPLMMLKVLIFAYCKGMTGSRKICEALHESVYFKFLSASQEPDFRTINRFRTSHFPNFIELFKEVLKTCQEMKLMKMGRVALDGKRVQGNASLSQNRDIDQIDEIVRKIMDEAVRIDAEEDALYGPDNQGDELPEELRTTEGQPHGPG